MLPCTKIIAILFPIISCQVYPDPIWTRATPESQGMDSYVLENASLFAGQQLSDTFVVTRNGFLVGEWYFNNATADTQSELWSATKCYISALIGIAQSQGLLSISDYAWRFIPEWENTDAHNVTIRSLLSMASGRHWDFFTDYVLLWRANSQARFSINLRQDHEPYVWWEYNNAAYRCLIHILRVAARKEGYSLAEYANAFLFDILKTHPRQSWMTDPSGEEIVMLSNAIDMAKFGYLFLQKGFWSNGFPVLHLNFVEESVRVTSPLNSAYGYMWWLNYEGHWVAPSTATERIEGDGQYFGAQVPSYVYSAQGAGGQLIIVDPVLQLVITRQGEGLELVILRHNFI